MRDPAVRRMLRRSLAAAGSEVEFRDSLTTDPIGPGTILFIDQASRREATVTRFMHAVAEAERVVIVGESLADSNLVALLQQRALDHLISESKPDEEELVVTAMKLLSGDLFGPEKYLPWGAKISQADVSCYEHKWDALNLVGEAAGWPARGGSSSPTSRAPPTSC